MNGPFQVAQATGAGNSISNSNTPPRIFKLTKPLADQSVVINLGYEQKVQVDFSAIANEKITLVHIGEKLIILFDNQSTVTVEPFFDSRHDALGNLTIQVAPGRDLTVSEFANTFTITTDTSVLPAAGTGGNAQASGANFRPPLVDDLPPIGTNRLAPPEALGNLEFTNPTFNGLPLESPPPPPPPPPPINPILIVAGIGPQLAVDESFIPPIPTIGSGQGPATFSNIASEAFAASFTVTADPSVQFSVTYALTLNGGASSLLTTLVDSKSNTAVTLFQISPTEIDARNAGGDLVFRLTVDGTGHVTMEALRGVHENTPGDFNEGNALAAGLVSLTATVTDTNNTTATASIDLGPHITIHDDGPLNNGVTLQAAVFEDGLTLANSLNQSVGNPEAGHTAVSATYTAAQILSLVTIGADAPGTVKLAGAALEGTLTGLESQGVAVTYHIVSGTEIDGVAGGRVVFTLVDDGAGNFTFTLKDQVDHLPLNAASGDSDASVTIDFAKAFVVTDADGDSIALDNGAVVAIENDVPVNNDTTLTVQTVFEDGLTNANSNNQSVGNPEAGHTAVTATYTGAQILSLVTIGADEPGKVALAGASIEGTSTGLQSKGLAVTYHVASATEIDGVTSDGRTVFTLVQTAGGDGTLGTADDVFTFSLKDQVDHLPLNAASGDNDASVIIDIAKAFVVTDFDGDPVQLDNGATVAIENDVPIILAKTNLVYANSDNGTGDVGGTGIYHYSIGADERTTFDSTHSDFAPITLSGTVGSAAITNATVNWSSETSTTAVFTVAFDYQGNPSSSTLTHDTGTLTFDKVAGTYNLVLDDPIQSVTIVTTSQQGLVFQGYNLDSSTPDNSGPADVKTAQLDTNFFVQFYADHAVGGGSPTPLTASAVDGSANNYSSGELFHAATTSVTASSSALGVASNTIQSGEVLNMDFFTADPKGFTDPTPPPAGVDTALASTIFLTFDGIGTTDDLIVNLKLIDLGADGVLGGTGINADTEITRAVRVDNTDIFHFGSNLSAFGINITGSNDGAVIIESNDYNFGSEHYLIEGAQILSSSNGITSTAGSVIDLNGATGAGGASSLTDSFSTVQDSGGSTGGTWDGDVIKVTSAGFITSTTTTQNADLQFGVTNVDFDGDTTTTQTLDVQITGGTTMNGTPNVDVLQSSAGNDTMTGNGGNDIFALNGHSSAPNVGAGGHDNITDFASLADQIFVNVDSLNLTIGTSVGISASGPTQQFTSSTATGGTEADASAWNESANTNKFFFNAGSHELWYSANGTGSDKIDLAHISTGVVAADIHIG
jgi:hypothetical protein